VDRGTAFGPGPVVVAVDGDRCAAAVEWAAAEAATRGGPLVIVHPSRRPLVVDPMGMCSVSEAAVRSLALVEQDVLRDARRRALGVASDLEVVTGLLPGSPVRVLQAESRNAALLVLAGGGDRRGTRLSAQVLAGGSCPVVVVRPCSGPGLPRTAPPRVVLGVDPTAPAMAALGFAFRAAQQRGVPLAAVHAWRRDPCADLEGVSAPDQISESTARERLERLLRPWRRRFPDVRVESRTECGEVADVLVRQAQGAALLVLGARDRGRRWPWPTPVTHRVVRDATAPVALVRSTATSPEVLATPSSRSSRTARVARTRRPWSGPASSR
jgi:nucleotide-binding universal stress UspA family protein